MTSTNAQRINALCQQAIDQFALSNDPLCSKQLASQLDIPYDDAQSLVCRLILRNQITAVGRNHKQRPVYLLRADRPTTPWSPSS